jgi:hypothetical protein
VSYELIALFMFASMMALLLTGQRVFGVIGAVAVIAALPLLGHRRRRDRVHGNRSS